MFQSSRWSSPFLLPCHHSLYTHLNDCAIFRARSIKFDCSVFAFLTSGFVSQWFFFTPALLRYVWRSLLSFLLSSSWSYLAASRVPNFDPLSRRLASIRRSDILCLQIRSWKGYSGSNEPAKNDSKSSSRLIHNSQVLRWIIGAAEEQLECTYYNLRRFFSSQLSGGRSEIGHLMELRELPPKLPGIL